MGAEDPALGKMRKTTGVDAEKAGGNLSSGGFMTRGGIWTLQGPERRRRWGKREAAEIIDEGYDAMPPPRDNQVNAEALKEGGDNDGVGATG
jgi:hypothetical protein